MTLPAQARIAKILEATHTTHRCIHELIEILTADFTPSEQREFLNWVTGCPRLPIGGLTAIGKITVVRKTVDSGAPAGESHLPSCNTCFRYLKLPTYPTKAILAEKVCALFFWCTRVATRPHHANSSGKPFARVRVASV